MTARDTVVEREIRAVLSQYELGRLLDFERNERGFVNTSFALETELGGVGRKYFLRCYKRGTGEDEIKFEHSIIQRLLEKDFHRVAAVIPTRSGETYLRHYLADGTGAAYYAIFEFLSGEDRYTWVDPHCSPQEIAEAAAVLAQFHLAVSDLAPQGRKAEPKIFDLLRLIPASLEASLSASKDPVVESYLAENAASIRAHLARTIAALEDHQCQACPQIIIHGDFHPGNLQFSGSQVSALFDFDWSKIDARCFDLGLALFYFFSSWGENDGHLRLGEIRLFLKSYQSAFSARSALGMLTPTEWRCLPAMIQAGNLYVLNWALQDYLNKDIDPAEYLVYVKHGINTLRCLEQEGVLIDSFMKEIDG